MLPRATFRKLRVQVSQASMATKATSDRGLSCKYIYVKLFAPRARKHVYRNLRNSLECRGANARMINDPFWITGSAKE